MDFKIIADSCCDMTAELRKRLGVISVPLTLILGDRHFVDDENLDIQAFIADMKACTDKIGSAAPPPMLYKEAFAPEYTSFGVTLSSKLSGSYESAIVGKTMAEEEYGADVHVFDSKSATAGEVLLAIKIRELIDAGLKKANIIPAVEKFINEMKTYFILQNLNNLLRNGRLNKVVGKVISALNVKPLMGADGDGNIALFSHARGQNQIVSKLADTIEKSGKNTEGENAVITHCNCPGLAERLKNAIASRYNFKEIFIVQTNGVASVYADDQGIVLAF